MRRLVAMLHVSQGFVFSAKLQQFQELVSWDGFWRVTLRHRLAFFEHDSINPSIASRAMLLASSASRHR